MEMCPQPHNGRKRVTVDSNGEFKFTSRLTSVMAILNSYAHCTAPAYDFVAGSLKRKPRATRLQPSSLGQSGLRSLFSQRYFRRLQVDQRPYEIVLEKPASATPLRRVLTGSGRWAFMNGKRWTGSSGPSISA